MCVFVVPFTSKLISQSAKGAKLIQCQREHHHSSDDKRRLWKLLDEAKEDDLLQWQNLDFFSAKRKVEFSSVKNHIANALAQFTASIIYENNIPKRENNMLCSQIDIS